MHCGKICQVRQLHEKYQSFMITTAHHISRSTRHPSPCSWYVCDYIKLNIYWFRKSCPRLGAYLRFILATRDVALYMPFRNALQSPNQIVGLQTLMWHLMRRRIQYGKLDSVSPIHSLPHFILHLPIMLLISRRYRLILTSTRHFICFFIKYSLFAHLFVFRWRTPARLWTCIVQMSKIGRNRLPRGSGLAPCHHPHFRVVTFNHSSPIRSIDIQPAWK